MPNSLAYLALLFWPLICVGLFRRLDLARAIVWSLLGGYLLLPPVANFNLPLLPSLDKTTVPSLSVLAICLWLYGRSALAAPHGRLPRLLLAVFVLGAVPTVLVNTAPMVFSTLPNAEPIIFRSWELPGLRFRDIFSAVGNQLIALIPFLLARRYLADAEAIRAFLFALVASALVYSVPALIEVRLSPQLNVWIYGFFQHEFLQTMRAGGFRPLVFLSHPLWMAFFVVTALMAAATLQRDAQPPLRARVRFATAYLFGLLYLCKSLASFAYGLVLLPLLLLGRSRMVVLVAVAFALVATVYPMLRGAGLVPVDALLDWARSINPERAASLAYRFDNETLLLERAAQKPFLGWGGWGRNLVFDAETRDILTIPDGRWIIVFGTYGWLGYLAEFGLLSLPVFMIAREALRPGSHGLSYLAAGLTLILALNLMDMLLNAALTPITWMMAGALLGHAETLRRARKGALGNPVSAAAPLIGATAPSSTRRGLL